MIPVKKSNGQKEQSSDASDQRNSKMQNHTDQKGIDRVIGEDEYGLSNGNNRIQPLIINKEAYQAYYNTTGV